jgi:hypothetical protein
LSYFMVYNYFFVTFEFLVCIYFFVIFI